ncbi:outer membrane protein transport protein [Vibrio splendidus]|uniref:outer membrane protein transport protein n=1 Tax=Vibrio splendidus TaxID=29497 RepID=UPI0034A0B72A
MKTIQRSLVSLSVLFACNSLAAGFQVAEHSASGLGRAFSGEGAVADNASVLARNPAAMTLFDTAQFSGAVSIVDPEVNVYDVDNNEHSKDVAPLQVVPAAYYISPINDNWAWGIGMFTTYGVATDYPDDISVGDMAGDTSLLSVNINPNVAYRINEQFSVGGGINLVYAHAELTRHKGSLAPLFGPGSKKSDNLIGMEGDTFAWGWNIGALYELNENNRFGFGYRSKVDLDFDDGEFSSYDSGIANAAKVDGRLQISLPSIIELSAFHQLNEAWAIHYGWQQTDWSTFKELKATSKDCAGGVCLFKPEKYEDNNRYSFGGTYTLNNQWTLRAGIAYDEQAGEATLSIPDSDRFWYCAGVTYAMTENLTFDAGFAFIKSKSGSFTETDAADQEITFDSEGTAYISSVQMNYTFN